MEKGSHDFMTDYPRKLCALRCLDAFACSDHVKNTLSARHLVTVMHDYIGFVEFRSVSGFATEERSSRRCFRG